MRNFGPDLIVYAASELPFGQLPLIEEYDRAFHVKFPSGFAMFLNDPRVGTREMSCDELWAELSMAQEEWNFWKPSKGTGLDDGGDRAGDWVAGVLLRLGWRWV